VKIRPDCIQHPVRLVPRGFVPDGGKPYKVQDGDSWITLGEDFGLASSASFDPWLLIRFNYPYLPPDLQRASREVNWYLQHYVGCTQVTPDRRNYAFSSSATPGIIYQPEAAKYAVALPVLTTLKDRRHSIMANTPGIFIVDDSALAPPYKEALYALKDFEETTKNDALIQTAAIHEGLDPEFVRAIVWMESTHGYYDRLMPGNKTIRPMNVHNTLWADLGISGDALKDKAMNIAAGARILSAIWERTQDPTPEKVATLYNQLGATKVNTYGRTVVHYMKFKPWLIQKK
jgi:hypothetical protein